MSEAVQQVAWREMAEFRCPFCVMDDHWNHQRPDQRKPTRGPGVEIGACRSFDGIHGDACACSFRPDLPSVAVLRRKARRTA